jgi:hypothetical protein
MPRKKKPPQEWTTEEAMRKLFPRKVINEIDREIGKRPSPAKKKSTRED